MLLLQGSCIPLALLSWFGTLQQEMHSGCGVMLSRCDTEVWENSLYENQCKWLLIVSL